ncbi:MAG: TonB family protein [Ignavibacteria bacterium]|nr:TonB family protein [Ignavibacteria bacterium]MCU7504881.1 TonB family protein [Ignavibacteria bacterium]MCU7517837.1 TonB family protein [Ignavibacteria bacterium]
MKVNISYFLLLLIIPFLNIKAQDGLIKDYYDNGHLKSAVYYANDILHGTARWFHENGVLKEEKNYEMGKLNGWIRTYYENSAPKLELFIKDGKRDGIAKEYYENGGLKTYLVYVEGILKEKKEYGYDVTLPAPDPAGKTNDMLMKGGPRKSTTLSSNENSAAPGAENLVKTQNSKENSDEFFLAVEEYPQPVGGLDAITSKLVYPSNARTAGIEGEVIVRAFIDEAGAVSKTEIVKGIGFGLNEAAQEAVKQTMFHPGRQNGKPVKVQIVIPVKFKL